MASLICFIPRCAEPTTMHIEHIDVGYDILKWIVMHDTNNMPHMINMYKVHARNKYSDNYKVCGIGNCIVKIQWLYNVIETEKGLYVKGYNYRNRKRISGPPAKLFNNILTNS